MSLQNLSWLLIGTGIGIVLGEEEIFIFLFGIFLLTLGFLLNFLDEMERNSSKINKESVE